MTPGALSSTDSKQGASGRAERSPWFWVPTLYFAQGIPYVIVMSLSVVMYKRLGISNTDIALYTSWLYLPWVIKPLWSPLVDITRTKRFWVVAMQFLVSLGLASVALSVPGAGFFRWSLFLFWIMAFASATHDIAADGFYMLSLSPHQQAWWVGLRSTFYRTAMITGSGLLVMLAGLMERRVSGGIPVAWGITLFVTAALFLGFSCWHSAVLPRPINDGPVLTHKSLFGEFFSTFGSFFRKPGLGMAVAFMLLYRFDEAQLAKVISPFLLDARDAGGLGLTTSQVGLANGTFGVLGLTGGGLLGSFLAAKHGLKKMLPLMVCAMYLPKIAYIFLSYTQPENFLVTCGAVATEQLGYGFGFTAFMLYLLYFADGPHKTAHYAICTGFMALGMMLPGLKSGWLADRLGYRHFFVWVICSAVPGLIVALRLKVDPQFGRRAKETME
jgi:PAT family beta-lactamase induction signal transducer AmpG